jgi:hypothetical protein
LLGAGEVKRLKIHLLVLVLIAIPAIASAQQVYGPPVWDMSRLYRIVGYLYNIDPDLLAAIATAESNNNPVAVSPKGAEGLMQLMPGTAQQYKVDNPFDPVENVIGAARFLTGLRAWSRLQAPYGEVDLPAMIAAYNAGPGAVEKYGGIPPYAETQAYVRKVLWLYLLGTPTPRQFVGVPPRPRRVNPMQSSGQVAYAVPAPPTRTASSRRRAVNTAFIPAQPRSVWDQLAEIKRGREKAKAREPGERAGAHIN